MLLRYFYDERLAQASYLVGCSATGEALIIDPMRNIAPYLATAANEGVRITHIAETHIHADFVSGCRELAAATGAKAYLSDMGDADWKYAYAAEPYVQLVREGDMFMVGNIKVQVIHTPGHTPEHICFMITDTAGANKPMGIFTGDFLFVGDVGRPDLLETAAGVVGSKEPAAQQQFTSVQKAKSWPDYLQVWPGHGAGSACGKALGAVPSTTVGYEKLFNPAFQFGLEEEDAFVAWLLSGQPDAPHYFAQMKRVNKLGPPLLADLATPRRLDAADLHLLVAQGTFLIDLRPRDAFAQGHAKGAINIPATAKNFNTYVGWLVSYAAPCYVILPAEAAQQEIFIALRAIGVDDIPGWFAPEVAAQEGQWLPLITAKELADQKHFTILDVRAQSEYCEGHIQGALHVPLGNLASYLDTLPKDQPVVTQCASGYRSQIAASWLRAHGYQQVFNLAEGKAAWSQVLPVRTCAEEAQAQAAL
jgi:hydroxyacylglutathione hydrolase